MNHQRACEPMPDLVYSEKYEVQELIAQGGMGIVYKALDRKLNRVVALKVVHPHLTSDASFLQRFLREARAMARLQHENIVSIFSVEQDQGTQFIVMEYFQGTNLLSTIQPNVSFPLHDALTITYQMAKALAYAHDHGVIHRDVKPANVLLGSDTRVKLTDFGIAAALDDTPLTSAGQLIGTLRYMSPEQARDTTLDGRSDLYSLGLMCYEMVTGTHPRRTLSNAAILGMLAAEENAPPLVFPPSVPTDVQAVVRDLLRYRPVERVEDAHQLLRRLEALPALGNVGPTAGTPYSVATDATMCELGDPPAEPAKKKPENPARRPESTRRVVTVLLVSAAVAGGGAGLYALLPTTSTPPIVAPDPTPTPPAPTPAPTPGTAGPVSTPASPTPGTAKPKRVLTPPVSVLVPVPAPALPVPKPAPTSAPAKPEPIQTPPARTPTPKEAAQPVLVDQRAMDQLEQLRQLVAEKNLAALTEISVMSEGRRLTLETLFANYSTIEASLGELVTTPTGVTTVLRIDKLALLTGESVTPGSSLRKIRLTVPREGEGWGPIVW